MEDHMTEEASQQDSTSGDLGRAAVGVEERAQKLAELAQAEELGEASEEPAEETPEVPDEETPDAEEEQTAEEEEEQVDPHALEEGQEEPPEEKVKDEENAERSRLGRKLKGMEDEVHSLKSTLEKLEQFLTKQEAPKEEEDEDAVLTPENYPKYHKKMLDAEAQQAKVYEDSFVATFQRLGVEEDNFDAICVAFDEKVSRNAEKTGDPKIDAKLAFMASKVEVLANAKPKNPLQGKGNKGNTAVNVPKAMTTKAPVMPKLDPVAAEYVKRMGHSAEKIAEVLGDK